MFQIWFDIRNVRKPNETKTHGYKDRTLQPYLFYILFLVLCIFIRLTISYLHFASHYSPVDRPASGPTEMRLLHFYTTISIQLDVLFPSCMSLCPGLFVEAFAFMIMGCVCVSGIAWRNVCFCVCIFALNNCFYGFSTPIFTFGLKIHAYPHAHTCVCCVFISTLYVENFSPTLDAYIFHRQFSSGWQNQNTIFAMRTHNFAFSKLFDCSFLGVSYMCRDETFYLWNRIVSTISRNCKLK